MFFRSSHCYGDLCIGLSTGASESSNYRSGVIKLVLQRTRAPIRNGDSYQTLSFMEHLQLLQKSKGFTENRLFLNFFFYFLICGKVTSGLVLGSSLCWEGKKDLHCHSTAGAGPSTLLGLLAQMPSSAGGGGTG